MFRQKCIFLKQACIPLYDYTLRLTNQPIRHQHSCKICGFIVYKISFELRSSFQISRFEQALGLVLKEDAKVSANRYHTRTSFILELNQKIFHESELKINSYQAFFGCENGKGCKFGIGMDIWTTQSPMVQEITETLVLQTW